ncbi:type II toxin-antitoxin system VapC family toxin [Desulfonatronum parangueonense]
MSKRRTYVDANLLIAAWRGKDEIAAKALGILDDPFRLLIVSEALWLEVMPKPIFQEEYREKAFYEAIFAHADLCPWKTNVLKSAQDLAQRYGLAAMDAIHIATAIDAGADEFISGEKPTKPMFKIKEMKTISLRSS